jgi:hypothetical protein
MKALMEGHCDEPGAQRFNVSQLLQVGEKLNTDALKNVCSVLGAELVFNRDRINQALVPMDKFVPRILITVYTSPDKPLIVRRNFSGCSDEESFDNFFH